MEIENLSKLRASLSKELFEISIYKSFFLFFKSIFLFLFFSSLIFFTNEFYFLIPLWFFHSLSLIGLFQVGHDIAHGSLFKNKKLSYFLGQICFLPVLHPYHQWVYGHNQIHHGNTSKLKFDLAWHPKTVDKYLKMKPVDKLFHRIYWSIFGAGIYYFYKMWLQGLILNPAPYKKAKIDILIVSIFVLFNFIILNYYVDFQFLKFVWITFKLIIFPFIIWNYAIGIIVYLQHINEKIIWRKEENWSPLFGNVFATTVFHVPKYINFFINNITIHIPHHVHSKIPSYKLPIAFEEIKQKLKYPIIESDSFWKNYLYTIEKCKLIDLENNTWVSFKIENKKNLF